MSDIRCIVPASAISTSTVLVEEHALLDVARCVDLISQKGGKYPRDVIAAIVGKVNDWTTFFKISPRIVMAQILHETGWFSFTGDVQWWQFNLAGIGATGGVIGHMFTKWRTDPIWINQAGPTCPSSTAKLFNATWDQIMVSISADRAVQAVCEHHAVYIYGEENHWPQVPVVTIDPRYQNVIFAGKDGTIRVLGDYRNNWAVPGLLYPEMVRDIANQLPTIQSNGGPMSRTLRIVIAAGHHNTSGGHPREVQLTGPLTKEYLRVGRSLGHDMLTYTPNDGLGNYDGPLDTGASQVLVYDKQKPVDCYMEVHFQGLTEGSNAGRGHFCIHPDWGDDVDVEVRDEFGPNWSREFNLRTGMPIWTDGVMSEKQTGVGLQGFRLGVFRVTEPVKDHTTRMIIEHGSHTSPADLAIIMGPNFNTQAAQAFFTSLHRFYGLPDPNFSGAQPIPTPKPVPPPNVIDGFWIIDEFWDEITKLGEQWYSVLGPPRSGAFMAPVDGYNRKVQIFEKSALGVYPEGSPDGVPVDHPFYVRGLLPWERTAVIDYGKKNNLVSQNLQ
jgi:hypothetical protein